MNGFLTGWCSNGEQSNHHLCHHVYAVKEQTYTCSCVCHAERPVRQVARRPVIEPEKVRKVPRRPSR